MSRRPLQPPIAQGISASRRMAPGGRLYSESKIRPLWRPVGEAGMPLSGYLPGPACPGAWPPCGDADGNYYEGVQGFYWITWQGSSTGCPKDFPEDDYYYVTFNLKLTSAYAAATSILIGCVDFTWFQDPPDDTWFTLTGGPWDAGDVLTFTLWGNVSNDSATWTIYLMNPTPGDVPSEWGLDCSQSFFTVVPAPAPTVIKSRPERGGGR